MKTSHISTSVIKRLPRYYRFLSDLLQSDMTRISSKSLSERMGLTASQIRQDLNCFGGFGQQGYGYNIALLYEEIGKILGINSIKKAILVGTGNMGRTLLANMDFHSRGFEVIGLFDNKESLIGESISGIPIRHINTLDEFCRENLPVAAILCIPKNYARDVAEQLIGLGIKGFWNFTHYDLSVDFPDVAVENVHLGDSLMTLCYNIDPTH